MAPYAAKIIVGLRLRWQHIKVHDMEHSIECNHHVIYYTGSIHRSSLGTQDYIRQKRKVNLTSNRVVLAYMSGYYHGLLWTIHDMEYILKMPIDFSIVEKVVNAFNNVRLITEQDGSFGIMNNLPLW